MLDPTPAYSGPKSRPIIAYSEISVQTYMATYLKCFALNIRNLILFLYILSKTFNFSNSCMQHCYVQVVAGEMNLNASLKMARWPPVRVGNATKTIENELTIADPFPF